MTAITLEREQNIRFPFRFCTLLALIIVACTYGTHAVVKHGAQAVKVRECIESGGAMQMWVNPDNGREALVCLTEWGYGLQFRKDDREITSFIKNKLSRLEQVARYLMNRGYTRIQP